MFVFLTDSIYGENTSDLDASASNKFVSTHIDEPIYIKSDELEGRLDSHLTLIGNVSISQGNIQVNADRLELRIAENAIKEFIGLGQPAEFRQTRDSDSQADIEASADRIFYEREAGLVELTGNVYVKKGGTVLRSDRLWIDITNGELIADAKEDKSNQVEIVLESDRLQGQ